MLSRNALRSASGTESGNSLSVSFRLRMSSLHDSRTFLNVRFTGAQPRGRAFSAVAKSSMYLWAPLVSHLRRSDIGGVSVKMARPRLRCEDSSAL